MHPERPLPVLFPQDVPEAQQLVARLCELQADVIAVIDPNHDHATDCFCGESGFWPYHRVSDFRNEGVAVDFIERVVRAVLRRRWLVWVFVRLAG